MLQSHHCTLSTVLIRTINNHTTSSQHFNSRAKFQVEQVKLQSNISLPPLNQNTWPSLPNPNDFIPTDISLLPSADPHKLHEKRRNIPAVTKIPESSRPPENNGTNEKKKHASKQTAWMQKYTARSCETNKAAKRVHSCCAEAGTKAETPEPAGLQSLFIENAI